MIAKHLTQEMQNGGGRIINEYGQEIDPHSTLGRKQLVSMLKQRYGQDIENYRTSNDISEKVREFSRNIYMYIVFHSNVNVLNNFNHTQGIVGNLIVGNL